MTGFVLWFTGLSGSGKSTLAMRVAAELEARGRVVQIVDGDEFRRALSKGLTFSREDRDENVRRIGFVARLLAKTGACAITAAISPFREIREEQRGKSEHFIEVYCRASLDALVMRDPKGLYAKALAGEIKQFTGVNDPYEEPLAPEVIVETDRESVDESVARILGVLEERGLYTAAKGEDLLSPPWGDIADDSHALDPLLASGLLAPVVQAMGEKDAVKVERTGRLESGKAFPFVVRGGRAQLPPTGLAKALRAELRTEVSKHGPVCVLVVLRTWERAHDHLATMALEVTGRVWIVATESASSSIPSSMTARPSVTLRCTPDFDATLLQTPRAFALTQVVVARNVGFKELVLDVPGGFEETANQVRQGRDFLSDLTDRELGLRILAAGPVYEHDGVALATARTLGA